MLSLQTDYGLRILMFLAASERRRSVTEIASFFGISRDHVAKVAQKLVRLNYLSSTRGVGGGVTLERRPSEIRLGQVISDLEPSTRLLECVGSEEEVCVIQQCCRLRGVLAEAERVQLEYLNTVTLQDVTAGVADAIASAGSNQELAREEPE